LELMYNVCVLVLGTNAQCVCPSDWY